MTKWPKQLVLDARDRQLLALTKNLRKCLAGLDELVDRLDPPQDNLMHNAVRLQLSSAAVTIGLMPLNVSSVMFGRCEPYWLSRRLLSADALDTARSVATANELPFLHNAVKIDDKIYVLLQEVGE